LLALHSYLTSPSEEDRHSALSVVAAIGYREASTRKRELTQAAVTQIMADKMSISTIDKKWKLLESEELTQGLRNLAFKTVVGCDYDVRVAEPERPCESAGLGHEMQVELPPADGQVTHRPDGTGRQKFRGRPEDPLGTLEVTGIT
jgi:hypothetical protein